jgi:lysophospholipase L1-like esterase
VRDRDEGGRALRTRLASLSANLALLAVSVALTCAALEVVARLSDEAPGTPVAALYTQYDPLLGWRHRPGARAAFAQGSYAIDSLGLRDVERSYACPAGGERVLVLGDSFAEGYSVPFEACVAQVLERRLRATGCRIEVINAGVVGYSTDQELLGYERDGWRFGARVVVLFFYYNDILANLLPAIDDAPKPVLACADGHARLAVAPARPPQPAAARVHHPPPYPWHSAALEWLRKRLSAWPEAYAVMADAGAWPQLAAAPPPDELELFERRRPASARRAWQQTACLIGALNRAVAAHGARLVIAYVPSKMEVSERAWGLTRLRYRIDAGLWERDRVARDLLQLGAAMGVPVLDLTTALHAHDSALLGGPYHSHGGHWNALGHRVAAQELERFLRALSLVETCPVGRHR